MRRLSRLYCHKGWLILQNTSVLFSLFRMTLIFFYVLYPFKTWPILTLHIFLSFLAPSLSPSSYLPVPALSFICMNSLYSLLSVSWRILPYHASPEFHNDSDCWYKCPFRGHFYWNFLIAHIFCRWYSSYSLCVSIHYHITRYYVAVWHFSLFQKKFPYFYTLLNF